MRACACVRAVSRVVAGWGAVARAPLQEELDVAFREIDVDKSGTVSSKELYHALRANGWTAELNDVEMMIKSVDKDKKSVDKGAGSEPKRPAGSKDREGEGEVLLSRAEFGEVRPEARGASAQRRRAPAAQRRRAYHAVLTAPRRPRR